MARKEIEERTKKTKGIQAEGVVVKALPNAMFRVQLDSGPEVLARQTWSAWRREPAPERSKRQRLCSTKPSRLATAQEERGRMP